MPNNPKLQSAYNTGVTDGLIIGTVLGFLLGLASFIPLKSLFSLVGLG